MKEATIGASPSQRTSRPWCGHLTAAGGHWWVAGPGGLQQREPLHGGNDAGSLGLSSVLWFPFRPALPVMNRNTQHDRPTVC